MVWRMLASKASRPVPVGRDAGRCASGGATFVRPGEALGEVLGETGVEDGRLTCSVIVDCGLSL